MAYNKYISLGTATGPNIRAGEVFIRKVERNKYVLFRLTYGNKPQVVGLTVPTTKPDLVFHGYLSKEEARKLK